MSTYLTSVSGLSALWGLLTLAAKQLVCGKGLIFLLVRLLRNGIFTRQHSVMEIFMFLAVIEMGLCSTTCICSFLVSFPDLRKIPYVILESRSWFELEVVGSIPLARSGHSALLINKAVILVYGGLDCDGELLYDVRSFDMSKISESLCVLMTYCFQREPHVG